MQSVRVWTVKSGESKLTNSAGIIANSHSKQFQKILQKQGFKFKLNTKVISAERQGDKVSLKVDAAKGGKEETVSIPLIEFRLSSLSRVLIIRSKQMSSSFLSVDDLLPRVSAWRTLVSRWTSAAESSSTTNSTLPQRGSSALVMSLSDPCWLIRQRRRVSLDYVICAFYNCVAER